MARLLYPAVIKNGPNNHKLPPGLRGRHSLEAWGARLGVHKQTSFDGGDWQTWSPEMQTYMDADIPPLVRLFKWLMGMKPSMQAVELEHDFATIIRRQEAWGFTFDAEKAAILAAELQDKVRVLEEELQEFYGEWWEPSPVQTVKASREVKLTEYPDVTRPRFGKTGKALAPYVGPPKCSYEEGATFTPIARIQFNPGSRDHVRLILERDHGWVPKSFTEKGTPKVDDEVLRALPWPEAQKLADYFFAIKLLGYVSAGKSAWLKTMVQEGPNEFRQHGRCLTIGTYTFRCAHSGPNIGQVPTRDAVYGHRARELFTARRGFVLMGYDGSSMQLRLLAHYMAPFDGGLLLGVFTRGEDPHEFMRDTIRTDDEIASFVPEGKEGRGRGKTLNYALTFGGGDWRLGQIIAPFAPEAVQRRIGKKVRELLNERFNLGKLQDALADKVEENRYLVGFDGRKVPVAQKRFALSSLLQMGEAVVMRQGKVLLDTNLKAEGLRCGVDEAGSVKPLHLVDYEFCADVHDESQADVRPGRPQELFRKYASECVRDAGVLLKIRCPLASDVKEGQTWVDTH